MNNVYGYCPRCGGLGLSRERRKDGNDRCENGHSYPSSAAVTNPLLPVAPEPLERTADTERAAVVAWKAADEAERAAWNAMQAFSGNRRGGSHDRR